MTATITATPWCGTCLGPRERHVPVDASHPRLGVRRCPSCHPLATPAAPLDDVSAAERYPRSTFRGQGRDYALPRGDREL